MMAKFGDQCRGISRGLDSRYQLGGAVTTGLLEHGQRLAGIEVEVRRVVSDNAALVNERREDGKILLLERRDDAD